MITKYTIYGERCSGTNYLEDIISKNFNVEITWRYGWKHFFGHNITDKTNNLETDIKNADDVLFICIVRDIIPWINSLYKLHAKVFISCYNSYAYSILENKRRVQNFRAAYFVFLSIK